MIHAMKTACLFLLAACLAATVALADDPGWPRELAHPKADVVIYQPQLESLDGDMLRARAAVSVKLKDAEDPVFGVIWSSSRVLTDRDSRTVELLETDVTDVRFTEASDEQKKKLEEFIEAEAEKWNLVISLDRVLSSLSANQEEIELGKGLKADPPVILYADSPSVLIQLDGEPRFTTIEEGKLKRVVNTPYTLVLLVKKEKYYLDGGIDWYVADDVMGPWTVDTKPPKKVRELRSE
jgi:transcriptional antiterminator Rof (Rho-off)